MRRRTVFKALSLAAGSAALAACQSKETPAPQPTTDTSAAVPAEGPTTGAPTGTLAVAQRDLSLSRDGRTLETKLWYPQSGGPYPLILFSHGLTASPNDWTDLLSRWAEAGFVVAAPAYPKTTTRSPEYDPNDVPNQPADAQYVITQVLAQETDRVDPQRIAAAGHSAGAITTIGLFSKVRDARLKAGVIMAGRQDFGFKPFAGPEAPLLFIQGKKDNTVKDAEAWGAYNNVPWPKAFVDVLDGGHLIEGSAAEVVAVTTTDFWRWSLYGDAEARGRLQSDATAGNLATWASTI
ncbi:MAG: chlorophyllase [Actinoplanes sp.]